MEQVDVLDRRRGAVGRRRRAATCSHMPGTDLRDHRGARRDGRHVGPLPLPRRPLRLGHVHPRLLLPALAGEKSIADGASIRRYIEDTAREYGIDRESATTTGWSRRPGRPRTRGGRRGSSGPTPTSARPGSSRSAAGSSTCAAATTATTRATCRDWEGVEDYEGRLVHPQHWPEDLDHDGKRVVVIGSGATAVTLVPGLAERAEHVTMVQRTPTYIVSLPARDALADALRRRLPPERAHR